MFSIVLAKRLSGFLMAGLFNGGWQAPGTLDSVSLLILNITIYDIEMSIFSIEF